MSLRRLVTVSLLIGLTALLPAGPAMVARPSDARSDPVDDAGASPAANLPDAPRGVVFEPKRARAGDGERVYTVAIDPGHGGPEPGAVSGDLTEKGANLRIGLELAEMLTNEGIRAVMTRDTDRSVSPEYVNPSVRGQLTLDLQARVDIANEAGADLFISIHNNGSGDSGTRGTEVWYSAQREFSLRNLAFANLVLDGLMDQLRKAGVSAVSRGIKDDTYFRVRNGTAFNIFVLGPGTGARPHTPSLMPAVLGESLFVSNPGEAAALRRPETISAIASGYRDAVLTYFQQYPPD